MKLSLLIAALPSLSRRPTLPPDDVEISLITADSRAVIPGALFVAYSGVNIDGARFIPQALQKGALALVVEREPHVPIPIEIPVIVIPDGREALAHLSAAWYGQPSQKLMLIGVTGTDGKTTTTNLIYRILRAAGIKTGMISTVNAILPVANGWQELDTGLHTTTPDAPVVQRLLAEMVDAGAQACVLEVTSHALAQHRVSGCRFDVGVLTNITHEHLDLHGSFDAYRQAKASLFAMVSGGKGAPPLAILNRDDPLSYPYLADRLAIPAVSYSLHEQAAEARVLGELRYQPGGMSFTAELLRSGGRRAWDVYSRLIGPYNASNCLAALSAGVFGAGIEPATAVEGIAALESIPGRLESIDEGQKFQAIVDFAHTPNAMLRVLELGRRLCRGRLVVVFGCAGLRDAEKRPMMGRIAAGLADYVILTAEDPRTEKLEDILAAMAAGARQTGKKEGRDFELQPDRGYAIYRAVSMAAADDLVLVLGKGHEQSMAFGEIEYPWDDRRALRSALNGAPMLTLPTAG
jgi:UDP-N-acetylmuramoyl-L-alanyl-D-glutamate--2,6-diaminopimelate ligase